MVQGNTSHALAKNSQSHHRGSHLTDAPWCSQSLSSLYLCNAAWLYLCNAACIRYKSRYCVAGPNRKNPARFARRRRASPHRTGADYHSLASRDEMACDVIRQAFEHRKLIWSDLVKLSGTRFWFFVFCARALHVPAGAARRDNRLGGTAHTGQGFSVVWRGEANP